ncbi:14-3-3 protein, partial [Dissoconium aciculare CBS 342.82]|uniref:14-3-3 protein n=1 Tax=Dissoconium aciculare CBS 342.82 TaxID=1314786 RepID=A0A6J3MEL7_9PEZI
SMAVSRIEEKILGRLARELPSTTANALLSSSLYQLLGLSVQLSKRLYRARKLRKLDPTRDTKSLQLYHHIIWLAREGLAITEHNVVTRLRLDDYAPEYRVMAAKMQASLLHVLCLFDSTPQQAAQQDINDDARQHSDGGAPFRDTIPSMVSEASYVTNPYAGPSRSSPPAGFVPLNDEPRRTTPSRPPGLAAAGSMSNLIANSSIFNAQNKVPATQSYFKHVQHLADTLLAPTHALRLSVALEHSAFVWECAKDQERARRIAKSAIKEVYASPEGLDDEEFNDAAALVQALGGLVKRGSSSA